MLPGARTEKLTVQEMADETLVFDHATGKAHCLNRSAAAVWKHCDGQTTPAELAKLLKLPQPVVELALEQLERRGLLAGSLDLQAGRGSRRAALRKLAGTALLPVIMTITAPAASAQASQPPVACTGQADFNFCNQGGSRCCNGSCITPTASGTACTFGCQCVSGSCVAGACT